MKIAHVKLSFKVPDDFSIGDCKKCPLRGESYFDNHYVEANTFCKLGVSTAFCPVDVEVIKNE